MSRLYELVDPTTDVIVYNPIHSGYTRLLTKQGAVFAYPNTDDLRNLDVACGYLIEPGWRIATDAEAAAFLLTVPGDDRMLSLQWATPSKSSTHPRPKLRLVSSN